MYLAWNHAGARNRDGKLERGGVALAVLGGLIGPCFLIACCFAWCHALGLIGGQLNPTGRVGFQRAPVIAVDMMTAPEAC